MQIAVFNSVGAEQTNRVGYVVSLIRKVSDLIK